MNLNNKKILVTGAGGFIGSHLTETLVEYGADVTAFIHYTSSRSRGWLKNSKYSQDIRYHYGDIRDFDSVLKATKNIDALFHLAALIAIPYSYESPRSHIETNMNGTVNVLRAAQFTEVSRIIHTSTSEVYGTACNVPIDEEHRLKAQSPYAASKIGADKIAESFHLSFGLPIVTIRPFNTYGPRQSNRAIVPTIITQALTQDKIKLGNLHPTRDLTFVRDTVHGFIAALQAPSVIGETINLSNKAEISVGALANLIIDILGVDIPIEVEEQRGRPEKSEVERLCGSNDKAKKLLSWSPEYSLKDGLRQTIAWIAQHTEHYRIDEYVT